MSALEVTDSSTDGSLQLDDGDIRLALLVCRNGLAVWNDLHFNLSILDQTFEGLEVEPDVVGVEIFELLDRFELLSVFLWNLSQFQ